MTSKILLDIEDLNLSLKREKSFLWYNNVNLTLKEGEIVVVTGPSGAGKSCLLGVLLNLISESKAIGSVKLDPHYTYLTTKNYLSETTSVLENLRLYYNTYQHKADTKTLFSYLVNIENINLARPVSELSFGTKRRTALYRTLAISQKLYFLDEPTTGFDVKKIKEFNEVVEKMKKEKLKSFFIISHESSTCEIADQLVLISFYPYIIKKDDIKTFVKVETNEKHSFEELALILKEDIKLVFEYSSWPYSIYQVSNESTFINLESTRQNFSVFIKTEKESLKKVIEFFLG